MDKMRFKESQKKGDEAEKSFIKIAKNKGFKVTKANSSQNKKEHWDVKIEKQNIKPFLIDVKSTKSLQRNQKETGEYIWLEFKGIYGYNGWLKGKATHISFEQQDGFYNFNREKLHKWAKAKVKPNYKAGQEFLHSIDKNDPDKYLYQPYNRKDRKSELTVLVSFEDMKKDLKYSIWKK